MKTLLEMKSGLHRPQDSELFEKTLNDDEIESLIDKARQSALAIKNDKKRDKEEREQAYPYQALHPEQVRRGK